MSIRTSDFTKGIKRGNKFTLQDIYNFVDKTKCEDLGFIDHEELIFVQAGTRKNLEESSKRYGINNLQGLDINSEEGKDLGGIAINYEGKLIGKNY